VGTSAISHPTGFTWLRGIKQKEENNDKEHKGAHGLLTPPSTVAAAATTGDFKVLEPVVLGHPPEFGEGYGEMSTFSVAESSGASSPMTAHCRHPESGSGSSCYRHRCYCHVS